jgi:hypothetical protein
VHTRSRVARTPVVPPAQPSGRQSASHRLSASAHKDRTWPATKEFLRRQRNPVPSALCHLRANCWFASMSPRRLVIVEDCDRVALHVSVLSGFPTSATSFFSQCPISRPSPFVTARGQRPRHIPLAREDIPHISHLTRSITPRGADVIPNFGS